MFNHILHCSAIYVSVYCRYMALLIVSLVCYITTFAFSGLLFYLFTASGHDCGLNTFFIVSTLIFVFAFAVVTLHPTVSFLDFILLHKVFKHWSGSIWSCWIFNKQVNGSILPASVLSLYCMYLCYSGLASEPRDYECNGLHNKSEAVSTSTLTVGLLITVLSVVYSAVRAGSSTSLLSPPDSPRAGQHLSSLQLQFSLLVTFGLFELYSRVMFWISECKL